jgi:hypothetical protein
VYSKKSLPGDKIVETVHNSDSEAYENADISKGDDICKSEETDPTVSKRIRGSVSDISREETVLQTQQGTGRKKIRSTKSKLLISDCELEAKIK